MADLEDFRIAVGFLRLLRGWSQEQLASACRFDPGTVSRWERALRAPRLENQVRLCRTVGLSWASWERLLALIGDARREIRASERGSAPTPASEPEPLDDLLATLAPRVLAAYAALPAVGPPAPLAPERPQAADRERAIELWERLRPLAAADRCWLVEEGEEYASWALALRLGEESRLAAPHQARESLALAALAERVAERAAVPPLFRALLLALVAAFVGNARRVAGDLPGADAEFRRAERLWTEGQGGDPDGLLDGTRRLDLEASLRLQQGRLDDALALLDRAIDESRDEGQGRLLLKKAFALEQNWFPERALAVLEEAAQRIDPAREPRLACVLRFNQAVNLLHLKRFAEALALLPKVRALAEDLGFALDLLRVRWLEARALEGLGRPEEAIERLAGVMGEFVDLGIPFDAARAGLELAALYLDAGRTAETRELAFEVEVILKAQGVPRDGRAAVRLFLEAAKQEIATAAQAREAFAALRKGRE